MYGNVTSHQNWNQFEYILIEDQFFRMIKVGTLDNHTCTNYQFLSQNPPWMGLSALVSLLFFEILSQLSITIALIEFA